MKIDNEIKKIILDYAERHKKVKLNRERLMELREKIMKKKKLKILPIATLRKWVKKTIREFQQKEALKKVTSAILTTPIVTPEVTEAPIQPIDTTRVYKQTLLFDVEAIEKMSEKILQDMKDIEKLLGEIKEYKKEALPRVSLARRNFEKIKTKIESIKKRILLFK
jgi:uncharacterized protein YdhG (YjbR/CyaY superfamily)